MSAVLDPQKPLPDYIIWLENEVHNQWIKDAQKQLEKLCDCQIKIVTNQEDATGSAIDKNISIFILDIDMGKGRQQEGLDALTTIKKENPNAFVCVFSAHSKYEKNAQNLKCDLFIQKNQKVQENILKIAVEILKYKLKKISKDSNIVFHADSDPNIQAYKDNIEDPDWFNQYKEKYVAFIDGNLVDSDQDRDALLERLSRNYSNQSCLCKQVSKKTRIIDIPSYDIV